MSSHDRGWICLGLAATLVGVSVGRVSAQKINAAAGRLPQRYSAAAAPERDLGSKPLKLSVFLPKGQDAPAALQEYTKDRAARRRRFTIKSQDKAAIGAALGASNLHVELVRPIADPLIVPLNPFNLESRISHRVPEFEATFDSKKGRSIVAAVFDGGQVRASHREFQDAMGSRITIRTNQSLDNHATHVAGTIGAKGVNENATGMAREVKILSYDFMGDDLARLESDAAGFQVSNHSYGPYSGWHPGGPFGQVWHWWGGVDSTEDPKFGKYTADEAALDDILATNPPLVTFVAAGNDRGQGQRGPASQPVSHLAVLVTATGLSSVPSTKVRSRDGGETGLDTVTGLGLAKNAICIGAVDDIAAGANDASIQFTSFTGFGPADDGRIKPDVVANGFQLFSTSMSGDDTYVEMSGTSMATPTACGIGALLWEHFKARHGRPPTSAEIKAALVHTARDAGVAGPDPQFGWGAIDALEAGRIIASQGGQFIGDPASNVVARDAARSFALTATGEPIRATIVWIDPAAPPNGGGVDDPTPALVNDLDARLVAPDGTVWHPYSLDAGNVWNVADNRPNHARKDRQNRVDNVEVIDATPAAGAWKLEVKAHSIKSGDSQAFALVLSGLKVAGP